jgi:O-antigen/teichoic acid export membrane protein
LPLRVRHIARNVLLNWFGTIANMAAGFFLSPFVLHRLGNVAFGLWVRAISGVGYLGLLDLGMQNSVLRFVSRGPTRKDHQGVSEAISAALWVRLQIGDAAIFPLGARFRLASSVMPGRPL